MCGAGSCADQVKLATGRHVFVSFAYARALSLVAPVCLTFALDNGAFSAWKQGTPYDWEGFGAFVEDWMHHPAFDFCVIPDVIDGTEDENDALIEKWKSEGIDAESAPVWHLHESLERLERLTDEHRRVCLGSSGQFGIPNTKIWWDRMKEAMQVVCNEHGQPLAKLHGMRMLNPEILRHIPLSSADSTNAERNGLFVQRFGAYPPPTRGQRAAIIAQIVETTQSASQWGGIQAGEEVRHDQGTLNLEFAA
jgi:hypothetical protein